MAFNFYPWRTNNAQGQPGTYAEPDPNAPPDQQGPISPDNLPPNPLPTGGQTPEGPGAGAPAESDDPGNWNGTTPRYQPPTGGILPKFDEVTVGPVPPRGPRPPQPPQPPVTKDELMSPLSSFGKDWNRELSPSYGQKRMFLPGLDYSMPKASPPDSISVQQPQTALGSSAEGGAAPGGMAGGNMYNPPPPSILPTALPSNEKPKDDQAKAYEFTSTDWSVPAPTASPSMPSQPPLPYGGGMAGGNMWGGGAPAAPPTPDAYQQLFNPYGGQAGGNMYTGPTPKTVKGYNPANYGGAQAGGNMWPGDGGAYGNRMPYNPPANQQDLFSQWRQRWTDQIPPVGVAQQNFYPTYNMPPTGTRPVLSTQSESMSDAMTNSVPWATR